MPRPLLRSISFWSGILVMGFVCWAWRDSLARTWYFSKGRWHLKSSMAGVVISTRTSPEFLHSMLRDGMQMGRGGPQPWGVPINPLPPPQFTRGTAGGINETPVDSDFIHNAADQVEFHDRYFQFRPPNDWILLVPYWLILLAAALPWSALLLWRARRGRPLNMVEQDQ